jgi:hypothetical protein
LIQPQTQRAKVQERTDYEVVVALELPLLVVVALELPLLVVEALELLLLVVEALELLLLVVVALEQPLLAASWEPPWARWQQHVGSDYPLCQQRYEKTVLQGSKQSSAYP